MDSDGKMTGVKRVRGVGSHRVFCSVDGCDSDLSGCKDYHRRHKVCEMHSKTSVVLVCGQQQRFCQQCSRFHLLGEFDEVKRSCRKRLDGHNKRRRKPRLVSSPGALVPTPQGPGLYPSSQLLPVSMIMHPKSHIAVKNEENTLFGSHSMLHFDCGEQHSIPSNCRGRQFPFSQGRGAVTISSRTGGIGIPFQALDNVSSSVQCDYMSNKISANSSARDFNTIGAPSLLSSPTQVSNTDLYHIVPASTQIQSVQPSTASLSIYPCDHTWNPSTVFSCLELGSENAGAVVVPDANNIGLGSPGIARDVDRGSTPDGPFQAVPFSWR